MLTELKTEKAAFERRKSRNSIEAAPLDPRPISDPYLLTSLPSTIQVTELFEPLQALLSNAQLIKIPECFDDQDNDFLRTIRTFDKKTDKPWRNGRFCGKCRTTNQGQERCQKSGIPCKKCEKAWCVWPLGDNVFAVFGPPTGVQTLPLTSSATAQPSSSSQPSLT